MLDDNIFLLRINLKNGQRVKNIRACSMLFVTKIA